MTTPLIDEKPRYSNGLAAAWMAQNHGMKFKSSRGQNLYWDGGNNFRCEKDTGIYAGEYYYIHQDSLNLLEPKYKDLLVGPNGMAAMFYMDSRDRAPSKNCKIVFRDGKPFHWPESEAL